MNQFDGAVQDARAATEIARRVGNRRAEMYAHNLVGEFNLERGRYDEVEPPLKAGLALTDVLGNRRFKAYLMMQQGRLYIALGRADVARSILDEAISVSRETGERFIGPRVFGVAALAAEDEPGRARFLADGEAILARGCNAHNHLWFYRDAIEASLFSGAWNEAARYADTMADFTRAEPLPWSDFLIARGKALAAFGDGERGARLKAELDRLRGDAERTGFIPQLEALNEALATMGDGA